MPIKTGVGVNCNTDLGSFIDMSNDIQYNEIAKVRNCPKITFNIACLFLR